MSTRKYVGHVSFSWMGINTRVPQWIVTSALERQLKKTITMNSVAVFALAFFCVMGIACGQLFGAPATTGGIGSLLPLLAFLLFFFLIRNNNSATNTIITYGNFSG